jgi:predicted ATPase/DNA-binding SARP family transcriptional activator
MSYVQLLGKARVRTGSSWRGFIPDQRYALLAYLAYSADWASRDNVAYLFWPDVSNRRARHNLRQLIKRVRDLEWLKGLQGDRQRLRWPVATDVAAFRRALEDGELERALALYGGSLLEGMDEGRHAEFDGWLALERERLHRLWRDALLKRARELEGQAEFARATGLYHELQRREARGASTKTALWAGEREEAASAYRGRPYHELEPTSSATPAVGEEDRRALERFGLEDPATLPDPPTSFIGRDLELAEIAHLLASPDCRLLTLSGPGGIGKTRLALQAAQELKERYRDGACFVSLERLMSPKALAAAVAEALHLELRGAQEPLAQVIHQLKSRQLLLVLDSFEHLLAGTTVLAKLVRSCPGLKLLVTSRERLKLSTEWLLPVEGMPWRSEDEASDAVELFVERAKRVQPDFALRQENLPDALRICELTQGLPLAIELAAVWVRLMSCSEIAGEIEGNLDVLAASTRNASKRHLSIRATFEHSWTLLTPKEREVLRRLSVFRGGFAKEAAAVVAGAPLTVLASLVDKSLVRVTPGGRYDLHPLLHRYALEKLAERPDEQAASQEKHGAYYCRLLCQREKLAVGPKAAQAFEEDLENIHAAWTWATSGPRVKELKRCRHLLQ